MVRSFESLAVIFLAVTSLECASSTSISCKNDQNADVPWFFIYKLPKYSKINPTGEVLSGTEYVYVDSKSPFQEYWAESEGENSQAYWTLSSKKINESGSALFNTIDRLKKETTRKNLAYALYNDDVRKNGKRQNCENCGHTKGLFMFEKNKTGVWLIHSVPNFPNENYDYPKSGKRFGQTFLCVTFSYNNLDIIAKHLRLQHPQIYAKADPSKWMEPLSLHLLLNGHFLDGDEPIMQDDLWQGKRMFTSFAKHGNYDKDVYLHQVGPGLGFNLLVSTWRRCGPKNVPSQREGGVTVENVRSITFKLDPYHSVDVNYTVDHSKWAISKGWKTAHVCVGTLNRVESQFPRGGGTVCFKNHHLHNLLRRTVTVYERCPKGDVGNVARWNPEAKKRIRHEEQVEYVYEEELNDYDSVDSCGDMVENEEQSYQVWGGASPAGEPVGENPRKRNRGSLALLAP